MFVRDLEKQISDVGLGIQVLATVVPIWQLNRAMSIISLTVVNGGVTLPSSQRLPQVGSIQCGRRMHQIRRSLLDRIDWSGWRRGNLWLGTGLCIVQRQCCWERTSEKLHASRCLMLPSIYFVPSAASRSAERWRLLPHRPSFDPKTSVHLHRVPYPRVTRLQNSRPPIVVII